MDSRTVTQEFEIDMGAFYFRLSLSAQSHIEDGGIGSYEFWGSKGYDVQLYETIEDAYIDIHVEDFYNEEGEEMVYNEKDHGHLLEQWIDDEYENIEEELITD